jgi:hypothetical protein
MVGDVLSCSTNGQEAPYVANSQKRKRSTCPICRSASATPATENYSVLLPPCSLQIVVSASGDNHQRLPLQLRFARIKYGFVGRILETEGSQYFGEVTVDCSAYTNSGSSTLIQRKCVPSAVWDCENTDAIRSVRLYYVKMRRQ